MRVIFVFLLFIAASVVNAQRPFYAGSKPIGYPELAARFQTDEDDETTTVSLVNRLGDDGQPIRTTTVRLPVDALGDKNLVDRISKWPVDKQPYWYLNWRQIEDQRRQRPSLADADQRQPETDRWQQQVDTNQFESDARQSEVNRRRTPAPVNRRSSFND